MQRENGFIPEKKEGYQCRIPVSCFPESPEFCHIPSCQSVHLPSRCSRQNPCVCLEVEVRSGLVLGEKCSMIFKPEIQGWAELPLYLIPCSLIKANGIWVLCGMRGSSFPPSEGPPVQDWALWMVRKTASLQRPHISLIPMETSPLRRCRLNLSSWCVFMEQPGPLLLLPLLLLGTCPLEAGSFSTAARAGGCDFSRNSGHRGTAW